MRTALNYVDKETKKKVTVDNVAEVSSQSVASNNPIIDAFRAAGFVEYDN